MLGAWRLTGFDNIASAITRKTDCSQHVGGDTVKVIDDSDFPTKEFQPCDDKYIDYTPCHDQMRAMKFPRENMTYRERHCPPEKKKLHCLIPAPKGYATPFPWPQSRDFVYYANAPYKSLTIEKAVQNWIQYDGDVFTFPGGGTQFPQGADTYINQLATVIPIENGTVRTALDTGCGVASLGAYLFKKNVITMSFAPRDSHEAQIQFALERGIPAVIGVLGTIKMPFPSRAFDMAHCSRCLIPWSGMYMMEVDRVLRPGGYWVLSGPPINWRNNYESWKRPEKELKKEQRKIEKAALLLCWEKIREIQEIAIWRKRTNYNSCRKNDPKPTFCVGNPDDVWYKKMEACVTPYPETTKPDDVAGGDWKPFPARLNAAPFRISSQSVPGVTVEAFLDDKLLWERCVEAYKNVNSIIDSGRYRNIIDMNAGLGSFAAALESPKLWVMNVMPTIAEKDTLGVIYERGLIGIYHDWCEAFSTYPRTYDLIHANGVFSLYSNKCKAEDILLEMDRILRPEGAVIIRDQVDVLNKVRKIAGGMRWNTKMVDHEDGPLVSEKTLFAVKMYWVAGENITASTRYIPTTVPRKKHLESRSYGNRLSDT
ncbi:hypothetical protein V6N12_017361 [Hibiscus sabdariffa]|uniref:Methyltransferase n=1 Tax=Hibiscus sabdariffa TaxID=183260 RepID=A0ABR2CH07_9ROSI